MIAGLVLAGGRSSRFGSDKALAVLEGRTLLDWALAALKPHCEAVAVSGRSLPDMPGDPDGPLSGVKAGLVWAREIGANRLVTLPCDTPWVPADLVPRLLAVGAPVVSARTADGPQPLCAMWSVGVLEALTAALAVGHPSVQAFQAAVGGLTAPFEDAAAFRNVNTVADLNPPPEGEGDRAEGVVEGVADTVRRPERVRPLG